MRADEIESGELCRPTRKATAGVYLVKDRRKAETIIRALERKGAKANSQEIWRLHWLKRGWIPFIRVTRRINAEDKRVEDRSPTAVPPDYPVRRIKSPPAYRKRT